jgi:hypothetical protein
MSEFEPRNNPYIDESMEEMPEEEILFDKHTPLREKADEILDELKEEARLEKGNLEEEIDSETQISTPEKIEIDESQIAEYDTRDLIELIYSLTIHEGDNEQIQTLSNLIATCQSKIDHTNQEIYSTQNLIALYKNQSGSARDKTLLEDMVKKVENLAIEKETFETLIELSLYNSEIQLNLNEVPIDTLISRYRIYQTFIYQYNIPNHSPIIPHLKNIAEQYHSQILHLIESEHIDEKYGLGSATGTPLSIPRLEEFLVPDTKAEGFWEYQKRKTAEQQGTGRFLEGDQIREAQDDTIGKKSEEFVVKELIQTPGVLMTIDIPKFSVGDTQYKADTIVITLDPEFELSVSDDYIQKALYQLIFEFGMLTKKHNDTYKDISGINHESPIINDIIHTNPSIKFSKMNSPKDEKLPMHNLLRIHRVQIKTRSDIMPTALEDYKKSPYTKDPHNIGLLAKEYRKHGQSPQEPFDRTDFQIAAQTILGLPIR